MAQTQHTPGPWEIVTGDEWTTDIGTPEGEYEDGRKRHWNIASVNKRRDEWEANRRLIAAAPELLEATERLIEWLDKRGLACNHDCGNPKCRTKNARAAIAKARGEA